MQIQFQTLLNAFPAENKPCSDATGASPFANQCAIRMSSCLVDAGVSLTTCHAVRCWHGHGRRHVLRAQELADWLASAAGRLAIGAEVERSARNTQVSSSDYTGRKGIVFFQNFWGAGNQGDHIDLWNSSQMMHGSLDYFTRSERVWFWSFP